MNITKENFEIVNDTKNIICSKCGEGKMVEAIEKKDSRKAWYCNNPKCEWTVAIILPK